MKKYGYVLMAFVCLFLSITFLNGKAASGNEVTDYDEFTGDLLFDENMESNNPDINWDTYVPKDTDTHTMKLTEKFKCKVTIECISGEGYVQFAIGEGEVDRGFYQNIYLCPDKSKDNVILTDLDKGEYNLQIALEEGSDSDTKISYKIKVEYFNEGVELGGEEQIHISNTNLELASGDTRWLKILEDGYELGSYDENELTEISWKSSDKKVATIDKYGELTPRKPGSCIVTGAYKGKSYECKVTVVKTEFSIINKEINLKFGARKEVKFKASPTLKTLYIFPEYYSTSNKNVAIFDFENNEVIAKGEGTCKISFTFYNGQEKTCTVKVGSSTLKQQLEAQAAYALDDLYIEYNAVTKEYIADIYLNNQKSKNITYVEFAVYQYDNKGSRINRGGSSYEYNGTINAKGLSIVNCTVNQKTKKVHACVKKIYYSDGKTWSNPLFSKWSKKYTNKF